MLLYILVLRNIIYRQDNIVEIYNFVCPGSELVQKYVGEGARMVRELFEMARSKKACLIFFDEIDAIGGAR